MSHFYQSIELPSIKGDATAYADSSTSRVIVSIHAGAEINVHLTAEELVKVAGLLLDAAAEFRNLRKVAA